MKPNFTDTLRTPYFYLLLGVVLLGFSAFHALNITPNFDQRTIGITVLNGQDAAARNAIYVLAVLGGVCLLLALFLKCPFAPRTESRPVESTNHGVILGVVLASNLLLYLLQSKPVFLQTFFALAYLSGVGIIINLREKQRNLRDFLWMLVALAYHAVMIGYCLAGESPKFDLRFFAVISLLLLVFTLVYERIPARHRDFATLIPVSQGLWPLMLLPLAILSANEIQYTLQVRFHIQQSGLTLWLCIFLGLASWGYINYRHSRASMNGINQTDEPGVSIHKILVTRFLPLVIATTVAFVEYSELMDYFRIRDFFHGGESLIATQQLLQFGSIPYIDFYPPHGLFDMLPQFFYQILNQTPYPESVLWGEGYFLGWLPRMLAAILAYWFLGSLLSFKTAFLVLFALPTYHLIHPYYVLLLAPALLLDRTSKSFPQWLVFWSAVFGLALWRIDFGIAALAAAIFVIAAQFVSQRSSAMLNRSIAGFFLASIILVSVFLLLTLLKQHSPVHVAKQIVNYVRIQTAVVGLPHIIRQIDFEAALQYVLLPLVAITYLAYFVALAVSTHTLSYTHRVMAYLSVTSLVISLRSLNRHSHFEGVFNSYFFTLIAALVSLHLYSLSRTIRTVFFIAVCVSSFTLFPRSTSLFFMAFYDKGIEKEYPAPASMSSRIFLHNAAPSTGRLISEFGDKENVANFLKHFLQDEQTFYDFTNSPLLYVLAEKKLPSFTSETLVHTSEVAQHALITDLEKRFVEGNLPVVLFKQNNGWDKTDGVDNAVRSYRVTEFIYRQFAPCATIDGYEIWLGKNLLQDQDCPATLKSVLTEQGNLPDSLRDTIQPAGAGRQDFDLIKLPYVWANFDTFDPIEPKTDLQELRVIPVAGGKQQTFRLQLPEGFEKGESNYIHLRIASAHEGHVVLAYAQGNKVSFDLVPDPEPQDYLIRISTQLAWHRNKFDHLDIKADSPISLLSATVLPGD